MAVSYTLEIRHPHQHLVDVSLQLDAPDPKGQVLRLPNWIPGSYMIRDFSRNIVTITATSKGTPVTLKKIDKSTWQAPEALAELTVHYQVYAWELSVRAAHVDQTHAFFNGTSVFLCPMSLEDQAMSVNMVKPSFDEAEHWQVATGMDDSEVDSAGFGLRQVENYDELIDHPVEMGDFKKLEFVACGVPHEVVFTGACHFDEERVKRDLKIICESQIGFFGEPAPVRRYVFQIMVVDEGYGGLEHRASTALLISRKNLPVVGDDSTTSDEYLNFLGLCSHEYFHTWNVKRMKPATFEPYQLDAESYTRLLWFFEGITSYYDDLFLVRTGLIDQARYLDLIAKTATRVRRGAGRLTQSVTDSSFDAWHKFYKQDENAPNAIVSYYAKGALVALCLDAELRHRSANKITLDELMKQLWSSWLSNRAGLAEDEPERKAIELLNSSHHEEMREFFEHCLYSTQELPLESALAKLGAKLEWRQRISHKDAGGVVKVDQSPCVWLGATFKAASAGVSLTQVFRDGPAEQAGLAAGDVLVAVGKLQVSHESIEAVLNRHRDSRQLIVDFFRLGELRTTTLQITLDESNTAAIAPDKREALNAWLMTSE